MTLRDEVTALLQELLRVNTVNPPGNETVAAELLRDYLAASGIPCELVGRSPDRLNLVARLTGGDGPSLALLAHTDTVRADPEEWARDPWSGDLVDGEIWGRGALDMKGQVAASAVAFASLWREGFRPAGDVDPRPDRRRGGERGLRPLVARAGAPRARARRLLAQRGRRASGVSSAATSSTSAPSARR